MKIAELLESGPWGNQTRSEISLTELQGTELGILKKNGILFDEKPASFHNIKTVIRSNELDLIEQLIGRQLENINASNLFRREIEPTAKLNTPTNTLPRTFMVKVNSQEWYLANTYGAANYIRFWTKII